MNRTSSTYNQAYNLALDLVSDLTSGSNLPTETELSQKLDVSRTTVRNILTKLQSIGIIDWSGRTKTVLRKPVAAEYFPKDETASNTERLPSLFMEFLFEAGLMPGDAINESELAKYFNVSSTVLREFLIRFSRFGLIEKKPNRHWILVGFTRDFAEELFTVREMFEREAFRTFLKAGPKVHARAIGLKEKHEYALAHLEREYLQFPRLDEEFHRIWIDSFGNRFVRDFFELISLIFHYHYRWNKNTEMVRNRDAAEQHLAIISALTDGDMERAERAFLEHLGHAKETLFASVFWDMATPH